MPPVNDARSRAGSAGQSLGSVVQALADGLAEAADRSREDDRERAMRIADFFMTLAEMQIEAFEAKLDQRAQWKRGLDAVVADQKVGNFPRPVSARSAPATERPAPQAAAPGPAPRANPDPPAPAPASKDRRWEAMHRERLDAVRARSHELHLAMGYTPEVAAQRADSAQRRADAAFRPPQWQPQRADAPALGAWWENARKRAAVLDADASARAERLRAQEVRGWRQSDSPADVPREQLLERLIADRQHPIGRHVEKLAADVVVAEQAHVDALVAVRTHSSKKPPVWQAGARMAWAADAKRLDRHADVAQERLDATRKNSENVRAVLAADPRVQQILGAAAVAHVEAAQAAYTQDLAKHSEAADLKRAMQTGAPEPLPAHQLDANRPSPQPRVQPTPGPRMR